MGEAQIHRKGSASGDAGLILAAGSSLLASLMAEQRLSLLKSDISVAQGPLFPKKQEPPGVNPVIAVNRFKSCFQKGCSFSVGLQAE